MSIKISLSNSEFWTYQENQLGFALIAHFSSSHRLPIKLLMLICYPAPLNSKFLVFEMLQTETKKILLIFIIIIMHIKIENMIVILR